MVEIERLSIVPGHRDHRDLLALEGSRLPPFGTSSSRRPPSRVIGGLRGSLRDGGAVISTQEFPVTVTALCTDVQTATVGRRVNRKGGGSFHIIRLEL